jgi:hypothetical protein
MYNALSAADRELAYQHDRAGMMIPPILSCGSTSSLGSGATNSHQTPNDHSHRNSIEKKKMSSVASAKELPLWLVGTFLLLHCEELAYLRNLSGQDERRFFGTGSPPGSSANICQFGCFGAVRFSFGFVALWLANVRYQPRVSWLLQEFESIPAVRSKFADPVRSARPCALISGVLTRILPMNL